MGKKTGFHIRFSIRMIGFCLFLSANAVLQAQSSANATFDPARVETGDTFALRVLVTGTSVEPVRVDFGAWAALIPAQNMLAKSEWHRSGAQWVQQYTLIAFDSATLDLPPLVVYDHLGNKIPTNPLQLTVVPTPAGDDLSDMEDLREIRREPVLWTDYLPELLAVLCLALIVWWFVRKRRQKPAPAPPPRPLTAAPPPPPAHTEALQKLQKLAKEKPWTKEGREMAYYVELSMIVREYLEKRYQVAALESTTAEIMDLIKRAGFPALFEKHLENLLNRTDFVKFAGTIPPKDTHEKNLHAAQEIVEKTQPT